ncbi:MAG: hypothetical protein EOO24_35070 [Comamonadaceae bacterium]|nr:MAG: hypothetical protein EOO24_35070 [Comamonadaceae bacterium]
MATEPKQQTIQHWSVVGDNRIVGSAYNRPGQADGKTILTSPVLQVRMMGTPAMPVAFTESGSAYWLADPSPKFGIDAAEAFVWRLSRTEAPVEAGTVDPMMQTRIMDRRQMEQMTNLSLLA